MKKVLSLALALTLALSMIVVFSACGKNAEGPEETQAAADETTAAAEETAAVDETAAADVTAAETAAADDEAETTAAAADAPQGGQTIKLGTVSVTVPEGWSVEDYTEGEELEIAPPDAFIESVTVKLSKVYGGDHAKEWADAINGNYGGNCEIDNVTIAGHSFYRVKAKADQNICFTDIDDSTYLKVSVMNMDWADAEAVLNAITID